MKKIKFEFDNGFQQPITEIFEFKNDTSIEEIAKYFDEWFYNELDRHGIEGHFEEID